MKLKKKFVVYQSGGESMLIPAAGAGFSGLVKGNKTLGAVLNLLKQEITEEEIVAAMVARFDAPEDVIAADVKKVLSELRKIGALDE